ncbi:hypothetical protein [Mycobacteroides abscessus]|uniref:Uncharacterized protein n=1 Tax=Mycobacteroides abscessus subsp. massiliense TaxID=1962118 RepID=A0A1U1AJL1_9MYCO|nr:hypothetical protein [Mycobacteroides abscessus]AMU66023.1 hypothetical protein A3O04_12595 [Mycobacteroides abscessus]ARQ64838.1 hypothetical protein CAK77_12600 [Mycobacteroides abscessus subsp. massiliense]EHM17946.1 hypothetical protein MMAS_24050 [Mycobacteroides abscessus subsp. massiliense CCUG 48898 = JCM 15300]EIV63624.1 hypothetical protein MMCCUG48898_2528 [Mycobacteroides abscessus subsp. massiliense CCUG 48898 = JCM 15300]MBE5404330.1 hypothetical protein [Mycobacteroides absce
MGTSGAYGGAGGKAGRDVAAGAAEWIDNVTGGQGAGTDAPTDGSDGDAVVELPPQLVSGALTLLRPRAPSGGGGGVGGMSGGSGHVGGSGTGGSGRRSGGLRRSTTRAAGTAGRAAAAAYAYAAGDRAGLAALGLDFDSLRALGDPIEVTRRIVEAACGPLANGTLEEHEERYVAASVAEWVLEQAEGGSPPAPEEIARHSIATVVAEVLATEINEALNQRPEEVAAVAETELVEAAEVLASKVELSVNGATEAELSKAIEEGIETLKQIYGVSS